MVMINVKRTLNKGACFNYSRPYLVDTIRKLSVVKLCRNSLCFYILSNFISLE